MKSTALVLLGIVGLAFVSPQHGFAGKKQNKIQEERKEKFRAQGRYFSQEDEDRWADFERQRPTVPELSTCELMAELPQTLVSEPGGKFRIKGDNGTLQAKIDRILDFQDKLKTIRWKFFDGPDEQFFSVPEVLWKIRDEMKKSKANLGTLLYHATFSPNDREKCLKLLRDFDSEFHQLAKAYRSVRHLKTLWKEGPRYSNYFDEDKQMYDDLWVYWRRSRKIQKVYQNWVKNHPLPLEQELDSSSEPELELPPPSGALTAEKEYALSIEEDFEGKLGKRVNKREHAKRWGCTGRKIDRTWQKAR